MGKRTRTTLSIDAEILERAHQQGVNISRLLENALRSYLQGGSQQQPQSLEQPNQTPSVDPNTILPLEILIKLEEHGIEPTPQRLKQVILEAVKTYVAELDMLKEARKETQESAKQPEQPETINLIDLFPREALEKLEKHGFNINDNDWLKRVIRDSLQKTIVELGFEIFDPKTGAYVLFE